MEVTRLRICYGDNPDHRRVEEDLRRWNLASEGRIAASGRLLPDYSDADDDDDDDNDDADDDADDDYDENYYDHLIMMIVAIVLLMVVIWTI